MDQYLIIGDETHDAVKELCRQAWDAGQRDMLARCIAAVEQCAEDYENDMPDHVSGMISKDDAIHRLSLLLDDLFALLDKP